ncbi:GNAT family N-acetyltransferase [Brevundimonas lutea]|uniref:GNAT family N-acetyltransferase n=1 Tax=Brevundimonas lutea TaxID=2293980 RepID=UPI000F02BC05|nr:N-acetyltransferase [Brevundimonas lutea]
MPALARTIAASAIEAETPFDAPAIEAVVMRAFGPGRYAKTAERLREGRTPAVGFVARDGGAVVGSVRLWNITIGGAPALFLGPIAVERASRSDGVGARLVEAAVEAARASGASGVLLVGDQGFFGRLGFACIDGPVMPGPVDPARLFWMGFGGEAPAGPVLPA